MSMYNENHIVKRGLNEKEYRHLNYITDQMAKQKLPTSFHAALHPNDGGDPITFPIPDDMQVEVYDFIAKCIRLRLGEYKAALLARLQDIDATIKEEIPE